MDNGQSKVSLLVPTKNRPEFLLRLLNYYAGLEFKGVIHVGDSSDDGIADQMAEHVEHFKDSVEIVYRRYPGLSNPEAMQRLCELVSTPYIAFVADDDFLVPSSIGKCASFLDENPEYVAAQGLAAIFSLAAPGADGHIEQFGEYRQRAVEGGTAAQRLTDHLRNYTVTLFAVHRADTWRAMYNSVSSLPHNDPCQELLPCCLSVIFGKLAILDCLHLIRQGHPQRVLHPDLFDWMTAPGWADTFQCFADCLARELAVQDQIALNDATKSVKQGCWAYLQLGLNRQHSSRYSKQQPLGGSTTIRSFARRKRIVRSPWRQVRSFLPRRQNRLSLEALLRKGSPYHEDFMHVHHSITTAPVVGGGSDHARSRPTYAV